MILEQLKLGGGKEIVKAELKTLLACVRQEKIFSDDEINEIIEGSKISKEEMQEKALKHLKKLENMIDLLSGIVNKNVDDDALEKFLKECEKDE